MKSKYKNFDIIQYCQSLDIQNGGKVLPPPNCDHSQCFPTAYIS
jgi:hypothetical protein